MSDYSKCGGLVRKQCPEKPTHKVWHYMSGPAMAAVCPKHEKVARRWWDTTTIESGEIGGLRCLRVNMRSK